MITTAAGMYQYFLVGIDKANAGTVPPLQFNEIINAATMTYLATKADKMEGDQRVQDTLRMLIPPPSNLLNQGLALPGSEVFNLPYNENAPAGTSKGYYRMVSVALRMMLPGNPPAPVPCPAPDGWAPARPLKRDARYTVMQDPFNSPTDQEPYYYLTSLNQLKVLTDGTSYADRALVEYLRYPVEVDVLTNIDPELPGAINVEITDLAIKKYLEIIESRRYPSQVSEQRLNA